MNFEHLEFNIESGVGIIRLNRPNEGNALNLSMTKEFSNAVAHCDENPEIRAVVLTGNGAMFCAGGDLKTLYEMGAKREEYIRVLTHHFHGTLSRLNYMDAPVITAINGTAAGGGFSLALASDLAFASEKAKFTMAYTKAGLAPDGGSSFTLAQMVGLRRAKEIALLNPVFGAQQALDWGLINGIEKDDELFDKTFTIAAELAQGPTKSYGLTKRMIMDGVNASMETQMQAESRAISSRSVSEDGSEGIEAFATKRAPDFKGRD